MYTIKKHYHFHAAHRNETIDDKCRNIHGHTYHMEVKLQFADFNDKTGVTLLFADIDKKILPIVNELDHSFIINYQDPLLYHLQKFPEDFRIFGMFTSTSCENLCKLIFTMIRETRLPIISLSLQETTSSVVTYVPSV